MEKAVIVSLLCLGMMVLTGGKVQRQTSQEITAMRLVGGLVTGQGRLEVQVAGQWGTVCDDAFTDASARVVCRNLGFPSTHPKAVRTSRFGPGALTSPVLLDEVSCRGNERSLNECPHRPVGEHNCDHSEDIGVVCDRAIRLVGGATESEGRLEVLVNGRWGTVCNDYFSTTDSQVVCRQLGFLSNSSRTVANNFYGPGLSTTPILMDDVQCAGREDTIHRCSKTTATSSTSIGCLHNEDVGIICGGGNPPHYNIRLMDGPNEHSGRLEVLINGTRGTVCGIRSGRTVADIACRMLEYSGASAWTASAQYGKGEGPVYGINCHLSAARLGECAYRALPTSVCGHPRDLGIVCRSS